MTREAIISKTLKAISSLPPEKAEEVADFASFVLKKYEDDMIQRGIHTLAAESSVFSFLADEEDLYSVDDIKEKY
jgi:hypothetical protein